jgi:hypothetical protein
MFSLHFFFWLCILNFFFFVKFMAIIFCKNGERERHLIIIFWSCYANAADINTNIDIAVELTVSNLFRCKTQTPTSLHMILRWFVFLVWLISEFLSLRTWNTINLIDNKIKPLILNKTTQLLNWTLNIHQSYQRY